MDEISKFLVNNWQMLLSAVLVIISVVVSAIQKKPITSITSEIYQLVCKAVLKVEEEGVKGAEQKRGLATMQVLDQLKSIYPKIDAKKYVSYIHLVIEDVLSTPQKKGDSK